MVLIPQDGGTPGTTGQALRTGGLAGFSAKVKISNGSGRRDLLLREQFPISLILARLIEPAKVWDMRVDLFVGRQHHKRVHAGDVVEAYSRLPHTNLGSMEKDVSAN